MSAPKIGLGFVPMAMGIASAGSSLANIFSGLKIKIGEGRKNADIFNSAYYGPDGKGGVLRFILDNYNLETFRSPLLPSNGGDRASLATAEANLNKLESWWNNTVMPQLTDSRVRPRGEYVAHGMDQGGGELYGSFPWAHEMIRQQQDVLRAREASGAAAAPQNTGYPVSATPIATPSMPADAPMWVGAPGGRTTTTRTVTRAAGAPFQGTPGTWEGVADDIWSDIVEPRLRPQQPIQIASPAAPEIPWVWIAAGAGLLYALASGRRKR